MIDTITALVEDDDDKEKEKDNMDNVDRAAELATSTIGNVEDGPGDNKIGTLVRLAELNTAAINGLSNQMGLVNDRIDELSRKFDNHDGRLVVLEHNTIVNRAEKRQIRKAVMNRVNTLLGIEFEGGRVADGSVVIDQLYRGGFISRCYTDAKNHSKMGESYGETLKTDFNEVLEYIESWVPEVEGGKEGYMHYLDIRREEREKTAKKHNER